MPEKRPPRKPKKPKKETAAKESPKKPPSKRWQENAVKRGYKAFYELTDEFMSQVLSGWSDGDIHKAMPYLWGMLQSLATQVGRVESLLAHSGFTHPQVLRHMCVACMAEAYGAMCRLMKHDPEVDISEHSLEELLEAVALSAMGPKKPAANPPTRHENVIPLPLFAKKED